MIDFALLSPPSAWRRASLPFLWANGHQRNVSTANDNALHLTRCSTKPKHGANALARHCVYFLDCRVRRSATDELYKHSADFRQMQLPTALCRRDGG